MPRVICYGEDGLTLSALTYRLRDLLKELEDKTPPDNCLVFYKPSFGRKGGKYSSQFGEFDGILATEQAIYAIEAKWCRSASRSGVLHLKRQQVLRHTIFEWLRSHWQPGMRWTDFVARHGRAFSNTFDSKPLAPGPSSLADNIEQILNQLADYPQKIEHIVLAFYRSPRHAPRAVAVCDVPFRLVKLTFESIKPGGLFDLQV